MSLVPGALSGTTSQAEAVDGGTSGAPAEGDGEEEASMSFTTEDIIRPEVGFLLHGDFWGKFLCSPCLVKLIRERLGTNLSTSKIERALNAVFKSPGVLTRLPSFLCDLCQTIMPCLGEASPRDPAVHLP
jgi:hypothetical protein